MNRDSNRETASRKTVSRKDFISLTAKGFSGFFLLGTVPGYAAAEAGEDSPPLVGHVISHTHWDRAWYYPFEQYRLRLVKLMRKLLDILEEEPSYKFHLDGQTIIIEDFLQIYPDERERIKKVVQNGQLAVGPFYVQPDEFLVSGESLIRNMIIGIRQAEELGAVEMEGYSGDNFGHPAQLPQLLQGFQIRSLLANMSRGISREKLKNGRVQRWVAPDGISSVCAYFLVGYANFYYWGFDNFNPDDYPTPAPDADSFSLALAGKQLARAIEEHRKDAELNTRQIFLGNGVDHQEAQPHIPRFIRELNRDQKEVRLVHSSCSEIIDAVLAEGRTLPELRGPLGEDSLFGTMTSRVYLQQDYTRIAALTEMLTEPLLSLANVYGLGHRVFREPQHFGYTFNPGQNWPEFPDYPQGEMEYLWKLLLQNSPHDDLCGCSVDATHQDMENRFKRCAEITNALWNDAMLIMAGHLQENEPDAALPRLMVFNPHPFTCSEAVFTKLALSGFDNPDDIKIIDSGGRELPVAVLESKCVEYPRFDGNDFNKNMMFRGLEAEVAFRPSLPACSFSVFSVVKRDVSSGSSRDRGKMTPLAVEKDGVIEVENSYYRIRFKANGTFDLYDKELKETFTGLGKLEDVEDVGDSYNFRRFEDPLPPFTSENAEGRLRLIAHNEMYTTVEVCLDLELPVSLDAERKSRKTETVLNPVRMVFEIPHYRKGGRLSVELENRAKDHHLFMWFPSGINTSEFGYDSKFDFAAYPVGYAKARLDSTVIAAAKEKAFGLVVDCPTIVESRQGAGVRGAELGWSLVRAVEYVNRSIPLKFWAAYEAQCLRKITRRMEWCTGRPEAVRQTCLQQRRILQVPPPVLSVTPSAKRRYLDGKYSVLPLGTDPLLELDGRDIHLSCWKKAEQSAGWVVRVYSLAESKTRCRLKTRLPVSEAFITDLNEQHPSRLSGSRAAGFEFELGAKEIKTLVLSPDKNLIEKNLVKKNR
jgi:Glycosyl hydrolases family 38 N-terminal domain/Glycosyl hydrolases family 38 C-terminal beta sandwich domain